jgi:hypothetical protein
MAAGYPTAPNFLTVQDLLAAFYGGAFVTNPLESDFTIGTTAVMLNSNGPGVRVKAALSNTGSTNIAISFNPTLTITTGILLLPAGYLELDWYYDGDLVSRPLYAISAGAGGTLHMLERFLAGA